MFQHQWTEHQYLLPDWIGSWLGSWIWLLQGLGTKLAKSRRRFHKPCGYSGADTLFCSMLWRSVGFPCVFRTGSFRNQNSWNKTPIFFFNLHRTKKTRSSSLPAHWERNGQPKEISNFADATAFQTVHSFWQERSVDSTEWFSRSVQSDHWRTGEEQIQKVTSCVCLMSSSQGYGKPVSSGLCSWISWRQELTVGFIGSC